MLFPISFILNWEDMLHNHHQTCLSATDSRAVDYSPFLYHWFLVLIFSLVGRYKFWATHVHGRQCLYKPASCPFHFLYTQLWAYSADGEVVNMIILLMAVFHNTFQCKTSDRKTMGFSKGHFMWFSLNDILQCFLQVINIWQPRDKISHQLRVSKSLPFCLCLWILFLKAKWPMNIFCNMTLAG